MNKVKTKKMQLSLFAKQANQLGNRGPDVFAVEKATKQVEKLIVQSEAHDGFESNDSAALGEDSL